MAAESDFAQQLAEARAALANTTAAPEQVQVEPVTGESAKGRVRVTLGVDGRVDRIEADPKAFKEGTDFIAEHVLLALNEALDKRAAMAPDERVPDLASIGESLAAVQDTGVRRLQAMSESITQVLAKLDGGR
ncbi:MULTISPECIES: YbaB/EbfC family nucleoid-associated protein [Glycomyces]|jgi:DNA-binding protein YbaB|uniref:DNA-binding protein YbaB n=2 Tax=Glycomyces TaxID=58113 RepID=A0A9X3PIN9_9ACTN|nr:YbaB/EbfC family nucleoid-associated protein [Glycomyces lechevalierae]MDA1385990.1 YbaB/EbfC family nucleoid-associated protein [Glycomyces lechevalierae]MDR7340853.1 DNA-binding protein YbaB [Glycomyces lechevalierae]